MYSRYSEFGRNCLRHNRNCDGGKRKEGTLKTSQKSKDVYTISFSQFIEKKGFVLVLFEQYFMPIIFTLSDYFADNNMQYMNYCYYIILF